MLTDSFSWKEASTNTPTRLYFASNFQPNVLFGKNSFSWSGSQSIEIENKLDTLFWHFVECRNRKILSRLFLRRIGPRGLCLLLWNWRIGGIFFTQFPLQSAFSSFEHLYVFLNKIFSRFHILTRLYDNTAVTRTVSCLALAGPNFLKLELESLRKHCSHHVIREGPKDPLLERERGPKVLSTDHWIFMKHKILCTS